MKTWTELQEWVEVSAPQHAQYAAELVRDGHSLIDAVYGVELNPDNDNDVTRAAIAWKAAAILQADYQSRAEGWAEVYYRDLKRMFEEES